MPQNNHPPTTTQAPTPLQVGIAAAKAGRTEEARRHLLQALEADEHDVQAWLWLSGVVDDLDERQICLENVLAIHPGNEMAQKGLAILQQQRGQPPTPPPPPPPPESKPEPEPPPAPAASEPKPKKRSKYKRLGPKKKKKEPSVADVAGQKASLADAPPSPPPVTLADAPDMGDNPLDNKLSCPTCGNLTQAQDRRCKKCGNALWLRTPKLEKPSFFFKVLLFFQSLNTIGSLLSLGGLVLLPFSGEALGETTGGDISTSLLLLIALPLLLLPAIYNIVVLIGLLKRWRVIFYLFLVQAVLYLGLVGSVILVMGLESIMSVVICGLPLGLIAVTQLFLVFNLGEDFAFDEERLLMEVDPDDLGRTLMEKGAEYAKKKMWALAALHFRQAGRRLGDELEPHLSLAVAYNNLKWHERMIEPVKRVQKINPADPRVQQLVALVKQRHA